MALVSAVIGIGCGRDEAAAASAEPSHTSTPPAAAQNAPTARLSETAFDLQILPRGEYRVGQSGEVWVELSAKAPYKANDKYPYKFKITPQPGIEYPASVVKKDAAQVEKMRVVMKVPLTPRTAGRQRVEGEFSFSVCTDEKCLIERRRLVLELDVK